MAHIYLVEMLDEKTGLLRLVPSGDTDPISVAGFAPSAVVDTTNAANITTGQFPEPVQIYSDVLDKKNQTATATTTIRASLTFNAMYLISADQKVTTAASGGHSPSSTIGPITVNYTCADTGISSTVILALNNGNGVLTTTNTANTVNAALVGSAVICARAGSLVSITVGYASQGTIPMQYVVHIKSVLLGVVPV